MTRMTDLFQRIGTWSICGLSFLIVCSCSTAINMNLKSKPAREFNFFAGGKKATIQFRDGSTAQSAANVTLVGDSLFWTELTIVKRTTTDRIRFVTFKNRDLTNFGVGAIAGFFLSWWAGALLIESASCEDCDTDWKSLNAKVRIVGVGTVVGGIVGVAAGSKTTFYFDQEAFSSSHKQ